jgi:hypothetical protein
MTYASISVDRRADYYARCAEVIAADPLDFYTRAEKGRKFLAGRFSANAAKPAPVASISPGPRLVWRNEGHSASRSVPDIEQGLANGALASC